MRRSTLLLLLPRLADGLRGPWAGTQWDLCWQPPQQTISYSDDLTRFAEKLLGAFRRAPTVGLDCLGVLPCVARDSGMWLEFGVYKGGTIWRIALFRNQTRGSVGPLVHGFDSFHGLPETWRETQALRPAGLRKGAFSLGGRPPFDEVDPIRWVPGWYNETLRPFLRAHKGEHVALLHVDSDLYSSASTIFAELGPKRLRPGCVIIFDELFNYREYMQHEMRALWEFLGRNTHLSIEVLGTSTQDVPMRPAQANVFQAGAVRLVRRLGPAHSISRYSLAEQLEARGISRADLRAELERLPPERRGEARREAAAAAAHGEQVAAPRPAERRERRASKVNGR